MDMRLKCVDRGFELDGEPILVISGAIHYARYPRSMWRDLLEKCQAGGLNCVETYVFWGLHEKRRGEYDFDDRLDLPEFLRLAGELGLTVFLRIGPYSCAEINYGGFPAWLRDITGIRFRTDNKLFLDLAFEWLRHLISIAEPYLAKNGGPIVAIQIENEYGNIARNYGAAGVAYQHQMAAFAKSLETGALVTMCYPPDDFEPPEYVLPTINSWSPASNLDEFWNRNPLAPAFCTEFWTGWYRVWGGAGAKAPPEELAYEVARFFAEGGRGVNYYMFAAGYNFGREGMFLACPNYDFGAPLDEFGRPSPAYYHLRNLHRVLIQHTASLLEPPKRTGLAENVALIEYGSLKFFCNNGSQTFEDLPARSIRLFSDGEVVFDSQFMDGNVVLATQPNDPIALHPVKSCAEPLPSSRQDGIGSPAPREQLSLTKDLSDYCWYSASIEGVAGDNQLRLTRFADLFNVYIDGKLVASGPALLTEDRGDIESDDFSTDVIIPLTVGTHRLDLLVCSLGLAKGDWMIARNMADEKKGIWADVMLNGSPINNWTMYPGLIGEANSYPDFLPPSPQPTGGPSWFEFAFEVEASTAQHISLEVLDSMKGFLWLNGKPLARYWKVPSHHVGWEYIPLSYREPTSEQPSQRFFSVPDEWLSTHNRVTVFSDGPGPCRINVWKS